VSEGEVAECVHEGTHLGGMALAHARHVGGGAAGAAGDQDALLSVRHPQELGSLKRRGGGVPEHAAFAWGLGESDGGGCAGELAVCQLYGRGAADEALGVGHVWACSKSVAARALPQKQVTVGAPRGRMGSVCYNWLVYSGFEFMSLVPMYQFLHMFMMW
jgi:hypothetical protein